MRQSNLALSWMLFLLTCLFLVWQVIFFTIHYQLSELVDTFVKNSMSYEFFALKVLGPLMQFVSLQLALYGLIIYWTLFVINGLSRCFRLSKMAAYWIGVSYWCLLMILILCLNNHFYPNSFFASFFHLTERWAITCNTYCLVLTLILVLLPVPLVYADALNHDQQQKPAWFFALLAVALCLASYWDEPSIQGKPQLHAKPNIILIGLDSVRPDYVAFYQASSSAVTPSLDLFLQQAKVFTKAYSPLARTYPAWIAILTGKYPKHNAARINMTNPEEVIHQPLLSKTLQANGYETLYATDEPRFVDIDESYGFDRIIGPRGGFAEFLLGGLGDFPLANLSLKLPFSRYWFPYQFGNRAATITYEPNDFINLLAHGLASTSGKPLLLSVHLCLAHWPHSWSRSNFTEEPFAVRYQFALQKLDEQVGQLLQLLSKLGILQNSIVFLFSDHGTTLGLPNDRSISLDHYQGPNHYLARMPLFKRTQKEGFDISQDFALDTSYGQGTDVLSLKQHEIVFAIKDYRQSSAHQRLLDPALLIDIAPTVFSLTDLPASTGMDGVSLVSAMQTSKAMGRRPIFFETADTLGEIEQPNINVMQVVKERLNLYVFEPKRAILYINPRQKNALLSAKQLAVLEDDVLFAHYPASLQVKFVPSGSKHLKMDNYHTKPFFVWVNLKTGLWSMGEDVPTEYNHWKARLYNFYQSEL